MKVKTVLDLDSAAPEQQEKPIGFGFDGNEESPTSQKPSVPTLKPESSSIMKEEDNENENDNDKKKEDDDEAAMRARAISQLQNLPVNQIYKASDLQGVGTGD